MTSIQPQITHYLVHTTGEDPSPGSIYGTYPATFAGPYALSHAIRTAYVEMGNGYRVFVTARGEGDAILAAIPVVDYPVAQEAQMPGHAQEAISRLFDDMDWTI